MNLKRTIDIRILTIYNRTALPLIEKDPLNFRLGVIGDYDDPR
jgi:hypothetical protein